MRKQFLAYIWNYSIDQQCEALKDKKQKKKIEKLRMLPNSYRDEFISDYYKRCLLKYSLKMLQEMSEVHGGQTPQGIEKITLWKTEIKNLEKKIGLKKESVAEKSSGHHHKAGAVKGKGVKDQKPEKDKASKIEQLQERDLGSFKVTHDLIKSVNERHRHSIFQMIPTKAIIKTMIDKALLAYERDQTKRKGSASLDQSKAHRTSSANKPPSQI